VIEKVNKCNQTDGDDKGVRLLNLVPAHLYQRTWVVVF